ncbi:MAG: sigma 54-interacting transcriptional regulator [Pseudomonadota bacterium]|nr:sigma 54-interacting transcriptional regulator [Pseudomonadota bacterium]
MNAHEPINNLVPLTEADSGETDLMVVHEAAKLIGHAATPEIAIGSLLRLMSQMLGLNRGRVLLPSASGNDLHIRYSYGLTDDERERGAYALGEGVTGKVMKTGQVAVIQNIDEDPMYLYRAVDRSTLPQEIVAYIAVPILDGETPVGVLATHRLRKRRRPLDADLIVMRIMATFIAQMLKIGTLIEDRTARLRAENRELKDALNKRQRSHGILGESPALRQALQQALQVADTPVTVLLSGESGTGKEKFSHMMHLNSSRKNQPFLAINCAAIPEQLLESELFGHERGAFTGATAMKKGKIELASGGTLFLDEIGDLNLELQSKLLRVLESQMIQRVGGIKDVAVDVRIIAATHKNLQQAVNEGRFRLDLFYRLNVFPLNLPPLRERAGDVALLARHFLLSANQEYNRNAVLSQGVMERLQSFSWPGNIRQLENVIKRAILMSQDGLIECADMEAILQQESHIGSHIEAGRSAVPDTPAIMPPAADATAFAGQQNPAGFNTPRPYSWVREDEAETLLEALRLAGGNKTRAGLSLGLTPRQFRYRLQKLGLDTGRPQ